MRNKLVVGAGIKCYINNVDYGTISAISWGQNTPREEERGIDALTPFELAPTNNSVQASIQVYRVRDDGGLEGMNVIQPFDNISEDEYFTVELKDRLSGSTYLKMEYCEVDSQQWNIAAKGVLTGQFSFHGLKVKNSYRG